MSDGLAIYQKAETWEAPVIGYKTVTVAGTQLPISSMALCVRSVIIQAKSDNKQNVFIGGSTVPNTYLGGISLVPGSSIEMGNVDLSKIYVNALQANDGVSFIGFIS